MGKEQIKRELVNLPNPAASLDPAVFNPSPEEWTFLRTAVSDNDEEIKRRTLAAQAEYVRAFLNPSH